jgi:hypothetical protein
MLQKKWEDEALCENECLRASLKPEKAICYTSEEVISTPIISQQISQTYSQDSQASQAWCYQESQPSYVQQSLALSEQLPLPQSQCL